MSTTTTTLARRRNAVALISGGLSLLIGLTVLAGYAARSAALVTLLPSSAPMRLGTALGLVCCGAAIVFLAAGFRRAAAACAALCAAIGLGMLVEAIAGFHIAGFDPGILVGGSSPRAGSLIACLLMLAAGGLILMSGVVRPRYRLAIIGCTGSVLHAVGVVAVVSYIAGVSSAFTTGAFSQLAIHTSLAIAAVGAALIRFAWQDSLETEMGFPAWLPVLVGAGTLATTFCLYAAVVADRRSDFAHQVSFEAEGLRQFIRAGLDNRIQPLIRMARHRSVAKDVKREDWEADAQVILARHGYQAIEWIDRAGKVVWTVPPGAADATPEGDAAFEARRRAAFESARVNKELAATRPIDLATGGKGTIVLVPVFVQDEFAGYVAGVFRYHLLFENLLIANPFPRLSLAVRDGAETLFVQGTPSTGSSLMRTMDLVVGGSRWKLEIGPTEAMVLQARSPAGGALLVVGAFLAVLFGMLTHLVQRSGPRPVIEQVLGPAPALSPALDAARLPVVAYSRDGSVLAWNETARLLFTGMPPRIPACETGFRTIQATLVRAGASPGSLEALRLLLDSCAQPALVFDAAGKFVAANPAAGRMLGWSDALWSVRNIGSIAPADMESLEVHNVLLMQGQWAVPASSQAVAAG